MKFSVNWLGEFVDLPASAEELADILTMAGVEIERVEKRGLDLIHVVVAQIDKVEPHPNADRLTVCTVNDGSGVARQIVCGAKNHKAGDKVPLAQPGAELPNGTKINNTTLRGVESQGMLCSPRELGLGDEGSGLLILSPDAVIGAPMRDLFPADTVFDVEITPNRGDLLSHYGLAREIGALLHRPAYATDIRGVHLPPMSRTAVQILSPRECPFYSLRRIHNVTVGPSPSWLQQKIEATGVRSINNIVDITNYVMLELGQPLHAFDADKISGNMVVRLAKEGEKFLALDGRTYTLRTRDLAIADQERAVGLGGVMGGEETGVTATTRNILLESAFFLPSAVRRTARELNLPSDASYRFERGVDPGMTLAASKRAAELIRKIAGGMLAEEIEVAGEVPPPPVPVRLRYARCNRILGVAIPPEKTNGILRRFGLRKMETEQKEEEGSAAFWTIPTHRPDLRREEDLVEEVVRIHGINNIAGADRSRFVPAGQADAVYDFERELRQRLSAHGLTEVRTSRLIARATLERTFAAGAMKVRNPLSEDHVALRPSLIPGLIGVLSRNVRNGAEQVGVFELGRVFEQETAKERRHLALLLWGTAQATAHWRTEKKRRLDLFDLKGVLQALVSRELDLRPVKHDDFALGADILERGRRVGRLGQLSSAALAGTEATGAVFVAELEPDQSTLGDGKRPSFAELDRFPAITRDIAMLLPAGITHEQVVAVINPTSEPLLEKLALFDLYNTQGNGDTSRKSLAYSLTYRNKNRTLTNDEVTEAHNRIRERLRRELGVELRE